MFCCNSVSCLFLFLSTTFICYLGFLSYLRKGKWSDLSVFDKCLDNRMFQDENVEPTFMFGQENRFIMIYDIRALLSSFLVYMGNEK